MSWEASLVKLSSFEVEMLQKRLAAIAERLEQAEIAVALIDAEGEAETLRAANDAEAGWYMVGFREGLKARREAAMRQVEEIRLEEAGARDALTEAFETLKKYENVAEEAARKRRKFEAVREAAVLDEMALRRLRA